MKNKFSSPGVKRRRFLAAGGSLAALAAAPALAQDSGYPNKVVKIVVPSAPGGSLDGVARIVAQRLSELWNQAVIVENRPGANFAIGAAYVAKAAPDGYTLLYAHDGVMAKNPAMYANLPYNPLTELTPVGRVVELPTLMYARKTLPFSGFPDFLRAMKANPGKFNHASGGPSALFISELLKSMSGVSYTDVPYKGAGLAIAAIGAGECDFAFADPGSAAALASAGRIFPIAACSKNRQRRFPDVPAIAESVPDFDLRSWSGLVAPARTPPAIVRKINTGLRSIAAIPEARKQVDGFGLEFDISSPEELDQRIRTDLARWRSLVKERGLTPS